MADCQTLVCNVAFTDLVCLLEFIAVNENLVLVAITLAVLEVVLLISLIVFVKRHTAKTEAA